MSFSFSVNLLVKSIKNKALQPLIKSPFSFQTNLVIGTLWVHWFNQPLICLTVPVLMVLFYSVLRRGLLEHHFPLISQPRKPFKGENEVTLVTCSPQTWLASAGHSCCVRTHHALTAPDACLESAFRFLGFRNKRPLSFPFGHMFHLLDTMEIRVTATRKPVRPVTFSRPGGAGQPAILGQS